MRPHRERNSNDHGEANGGGGGRGRGGRGRRGGGGGEGGEYGGDGDEGDDDGRVRRVPPVAENSVYIKGFPDTTSEDDIRAEVRKGLGVGAEGKEGGGVLCDWVMWSEGFIQMVG